MVDLVVRGAIVIDGTGAPARHADVAVHDGAVVEVGAVADSGTREVDADGLMVTPGFVDPHTHYDAQLFWDPSASPSSVHGVTSVIGGNCGFTLAPLHAEDADYLRRMMAKVEGMPLAALEQGVDWNWESFGDYLNRLDGNVAVNAGFLVGHCALRRYVMGAEAVGREATEAELAAMVAELHASLAVGGLGFSTTLSKTHLDGDGQPVASRWASEAEVLALCAAVRDHEGTSLEGIIDGCLDQFDDAEIELLARMSAAGERPLNWNVLTVDSRVPARVPRQLSAGDRAAELGGQIVALTMPVLVPMNMSFLNYCALFMLPGWADVMNLALSDRIAKLRDPETRAWMNARANSDEAGVFRRLADWKNYVLGDTYAPVNDGLTGRTVADVAAERGTEPFDALLDIVIADDLRTILWPIAPDGDAASWALRKTVWEDSRAMIGGSDAGAHLDRMCGAPYTTRFIGDMLRGRQLVPIEAAVRMITSDPARLFGLRDRGVVTPGARADLVVFDPATIGAGPATLVADLPGGSARLTSDALGVEHVFVNGVETVTGNTVTGATPGTILRSGRDTGTPARPLRV